MSLTSIRAKVRKSIANLKKESEEAERDAWHYARAAAQTEKDLQDGNWQTLAELGFITWAELDWLKREQVVPNKRRTSRRRR